MQLHLLSSETSIRLAFCHGVLGVVPVYNAAAGGGVGVGGGGVVVEFRCSGQQGLQPQRPDMLQQRKDLIQVLLLSDCGCLITAIICANAPVQSPLLLCGHHYRTVPHLLRAVTAEQSPQLCKLPYAVTALLPAPRCCITLHCCHLSSSCFASHFYPKAD